MADETDPDQDQVGTDSESSSFIKRHAIILAVFSLIAIAPVYSFHLTIPAVLNPQLGAILHTLLPLLLLLPLPAAYIASISRTGFRKEVFATLITAPLALLNIQFAAVSAGIIAGGIMTSYKAKSIFNGRNTNWTYFKAAGSMVTILAITIGLATAVFYSSTPGFREDLQGNITQHSVDMAMQYADMTSFSPTTNTGSTPNGAQSAMISDFAGTLSANISEASITSTESIVFQTIQHTRAQNSSKFDPAEQRILRTAFTSAENTVPAQLSTQTQNQIQNQFSGAQGSGPTRSGTVQRMVTPRVRSFVSQVITNSQQMLFVIFILTFSMVMALKIPFEFISTIYATILTRIFH